MSCRSGSGQPCPVIRASSRLGSSASKAPWTSIMIIVICFPSIIAALTSWVNTTTRSIVEHFGRAPPCWGLRIPLVRAIQVTCFTILHSNPLATHDRSAIGLQECTEVLSFLPAFGSITTSASFHICGKWLSARQQLYSPWIACLACSQQAFSSLTVTQSVPGKVLETPIVLCSTSSKEIVCSQARLPIPSQLSSGSPSRSSSALKRPSTSVHKASALAIVSSIVIPLTSRGGALRFGASLCQPITL